MSEKYVCLIFANKKITHKHTCHTIRECAKFWEGLGFTFYGSPEYGHSDIVHYKASANDEHLYIYWG